MGLNPTILRQSEPSRSSSALCSFPQALALTTARAVSSSRRLQPSLGNDCRICTASPLAPYAPKAKTASECGEVVHCHRHHVVRRCIPYILFDDLRFGPTLRPTLQSSLNPVPPRRPAVFEVHKLVHRHVREGDADRHLLLLRLAHRRAP